MIYTRIKPFAILATLLLFLQFGDVASVYADSPSCDPAINAFNAATRPGACRTFDFGNACYGSSNASADPSTLAFNTVGRTAGLTQLQRVSTIMPTGAVLMSAKDSQGRQVNIIVFGNSQAAPGAGVPGQVYTLRWTGGQPVCQKTPSGMMLQTPKQQQGSITVNGVTIKLGSTAFVSVEGDMLFDQDPRINRRNGSRNPNADLCSGFDSDCNFGNCAVNSRLVWGPFCRGDVYPYIHRGAYRVTLQGVGQVTAGATDYNPQRQKFAYGAHDLTLPASYTFCYPGLPANGTGFETLVLSRDPEARIDRITVEYLGENCAAAPSALTDKPELSLMTVYNIEGQVRITAAGTSYDMAPNQKVRIHFTSGQITLVEPPLPAGPLPTSRLVQWLTFDEQGGLPVVNRGNEEVTPPVAGFGQIGLSAGSGATLSTATPTTAIAAARRSNNLAVETQGLVGEVIAYDPSIGANNSAGIAAVRYELFDAFGNLVYSSEERTAAYCAFGGNGPCTPWVFAEHNNTWPDGQSIQPGSHTLRATVTSAKGGVSTIEAQINLAPATLDQQGPDIGPITLYTDSGSTSICQYDTLTGVSAITDRSGVRSATLWYRQIPSDSSPGEWQSIDMSSDGGTYYSDQINELTSGLLEYYIEAVDTVGNPAYSSTESVDINSCYEAS